MLMLRMDTLPFFRIANSHLLVAIDDPFADRSEQEPCAKNGQGHDEVIDVKVGIVAPRSPYLVCYVLRRIHCTCGDQTDHTQHLVSHSVASSLNRCALQHKLQREHLRPNARRNPSLSGVHARHFRNRVSAVNEQLLCRLERKESQVSVVEYSEPGVLEPAGQQPKTNLIVSYVRYRS